MRLLSKSNYLRGIQCKKALWLKIHEPDHFIQDDNPLFKQGHDVTAASHHRFNATMVDMNLPFMERLSVSKQWIDEKKGMFEGAFLYDRCFCMVDVLIYQDGGWNLIEVKSSAQLKPVHIDDAAFQYYILHHLNIKINHVYICHLNTSYCRQGALDYIDLFTLHDVTNDVKDMQPIVKKNTHELKSLSKQNQPQHPIGPHCFKPYTCHAKPHCWSPITKGSIFEMARLSKEKKFNYFFQGTCSISHMNASQVQNHFQKIQVSCEQEALDYLNYEALDTFIKQIVYPISYIDFECVQLPIPPFELMRPYDQLPIQYSIHIDDGNAIRHKSYLAPYGNDPRETIFVQFIEDLPRKGSIIVYNALSEKRIISDCLNQKLTINATTIGNILNRMIDLETPFKKPMIYLREMRGKTSLKHVLPALIPSQSYEQLQIKSGGGINAMYAKTGDSNKAKHAIDALNEYCATDTLGMHLVLESLKRILNH